MLKSWLEKRRKAAAVRQYDLGFDYAAALLLRGTSVETVDANAEFDRDFMDTGFADGMAAAIVAWETHLPPETPVVHDWPTIAI